MAITFGTVTEHVQWSIHNSVAGAGTTTDTFQCSSTDLTMIYVELFGVTATVTAVIDNAFNAFRNDAGTYGAIAATATEPFFAWNNLRDSDFNSAGTPTAMTVNSSTGLITCTITNRNSTTAQSFLARYRIITVGP